VTLTTLPVISLWITFRCSRPIEANLAHREPGILKSIMSGVARRSKSRQALLTALGAAVVVAALLTLHLVEFQVQSGGVCPKTGTGFCSLMRIEPLWQWIGKHSQSH
jgi:hypothetical protein